MNGGDDATSIARRRAAPRESRDEGWLRMFMERCLGIT
tara:strand:- start:1664 stop:1777 length:114 start_codon:yes stop_codon:yes gene_type:complete